MIAKRAHVMAGGIENARDAVEDGKIGMLEGVVAADGTVARVIDDPRTESAGGVNFAGGFGILHHGFEIHGAIRSELLSRGSRLMMNSSGSLFGLSDSMGKMHVSAIERIDNDAHAGLFRGFRAVWARLLCAYASAGGSGCRAPSAAPA